MRTRNSFIIIVTKVIFRQRNRGRKSRGQEIKGKVIRAGADGNKVKEYETEKRTEEEGERKTDGGSGIEDVSREAEVI